MKRIRSTVFEGRDTLEVGGLASARRSPLLSVFEPPTRPRTRGDCASVPRPCPFVGCRHSLASDEHDAGQAPRFDLDKLHPDRPSCSLDVAESQAGGRVRPIFGRDGGELTSGRLMGVEEIESITGLWHTAVEAALASGLAKMAADPLLREIFDTLAGLDDAPHPLEAAQRFAEAAGEPG